MRGHVGKPSRDRERLLEYLRRAFMGDSLPLRRLGVWTITAYIDIPTCTSVLWLCSRAPPTRLGGRGRRVSCRERRAILGGFTVGVRIGLGEEEEKEHEYDEVSLLNDRVRSWANLTIDVPRGVKPVARCIRRIADGHKKPGNPSAVLATATT